MVVQKERKLPLILECLEAMDVRLPNVHPNKPTIISDLTKWRVGYSGERKMDYILSFLNDKEFHIFHDLKLTIGTKTFQIDTLLVSSSVVIIIEVKNWSGTVIFDGEFEQVIRNLNGLDEGMKNPLSQVQLQEMQLKEWMAQNRLPSIPIISLVVFSNPKTIIKTIRFSNKVSKHVLHGYNVPIKLQKLLETYTTEYFSKPNIRKVIKLLLKSNVERMQDILSNYNVKKSELIKGIHCPNCKLISMLRDNHNWTCPKCHYKSPDAHIHSIRHYAILINQTFTISEIAQFINVSRFTAYRMVKRLKLPSININKKTTTYFYEISEE